MTANQTRANRTYDEIAIGDEATVRRVCTGRDMIVFAHASGNYNPLHLPHANRDGEHGVVAPSMWVGSLFSAVLGNLLPGFGTLYLGQTLKFHGRAHVGDHLSVRVTVVDKRPDNIVVLSCIVVRDPDENGAGETLLCEGLAEVVAPTEAQHIAADALPDLLVESHRHFDALMHACEGLPPLPTAVVAPEEESALAGAFLAADQDLIAPVLVGDAARMAEVAATMGRTLDGYEVIDVPDHLAAAARAVALVHEGRAKALMKGHLHTDILLGQVTKRDGGLRTGRRISHVFVMDVPGLDHLLLISDSAINIAPDLDAKVDITQNAIDVGRALGLGTPRVGVLSAVETVNPKIPSTLDAAILSKMAERGQIKGGIVDGPLAMDNAIDIHAAETKGITSLVAGRAEVLIVPNLESGNMLAKELAFVAHAESAGLVLGAKVPLMVTSRADNDRARLISCAVALLYQYWASTGSSRLDEDAETPARPMRAAQ
ncbi:bifunctional enoyl-CoA hydratase/phosphate acetyltransferase [Roseospira marina]|uniref:Bifunctional enoyl-CoA hydratase/phosphate acetyltransferase n=1 Tax=Roseospira marina TaxID=140057 RepID=A0A5M6IE37_9PROT|nr:bifunctional enoyl-CoA hydratase/phosphate acetyltransferase [Roseospira marina]KAA5606546.1 bifunctional enoyl-CoA hydratase/phosphate acetyltransferase [Roseospira marina]MBB4314024.1 phosphate butyryltransferase [Roseospira marina]MBB5087185.1 phosphate butyryltransferase [Roseospira marina]